MTADLTVIGSRPAGVPPLKRIRRGELPVSLALHPFDAGSVETVAAPAGARLADLAERHVADPVLRAHLVIVVDGVAVPREAWADTTAREGQRITMRVRPAGDDGSKILRTILQIAVIAVASWIGQPGVVFASQFWASAAAASVVVVGNLAINALVPPPQPDLGDLQAPSPTYSVDGARNQMRPHRPMPVLFGEHRIYPPLQGVPVQEIAGDDIYLRYLLNLGPLGLEVPEDEIRIGETPIGDFEGVEYELRLTESDPPISLYRDDPHDEAVGALLDNTGWVSRTTQTETTEIIAVVAFPRGLGGVDDRGRNTSLSASINMRYRPAGTSDAWTYVRASAPQANTGAAGAGRNRFEWFVAEPDLDNWIGNLPGGTTTGPHVESRSEPGKPFRIMLRAAVPAGQYEVELTRTDVPEGDGKQKFDRAEFSVLRSISARDPMPLTQFAYMALYIKASDQLSGVIDTINMLARRQAPVLDAAIAGDEDADLSAVTASDWQSAAVTRNPADNTLYLYRGPHTSKPLADDKVDWPAWAAFHVWCVDNAYAVDFVVDAPMTRDKAAQILCAAGRARPLWIDGKLSVVIDGPRTDGERQLFTPRSTRGFRVRKTFPGEVHALRIRFPNRDQGYQEDEVLVFADGYSELGEDGGGPAGTVAATLYEELKLPGITDPDLVWKLGRFHMYTALFQSETIEFDVDVESVASRMGDLVAVAHDVMIVGLGSGRVTSLILDEAGDVTGIELDETGNAAAGLMVMEAGKSYAIRWRETEEAVPGSGDFRVTVQASQAVETVPGAVETLTFPAPLDPADAPKVGQLVAFGETGKETAPILIKRIRPARDFDASIEAVAYAPERFAADSGTVPEHDTKVTLPRVNLPPTPVLTETSVTADGIFVRFDVPDAEAYGDNLTGFRVRWRQTPEAGSSGRFERLPDLERDERVAILPPGQPGRIYDVEITALGQDGRAGEPLLVEAIGADESVATPAGVSVTPETFTGPGGSSVPGLSLAWTAVEDPRITDLMVRARVTGSGDGYTLVDSEPPSAGAGDVRGLTPGETYDVRLTFRNDRGAESETPADVAAVTVPDGLVAGDTVQVGGRTAQEVIDDLDAVSEEASDLDEYFGEAVLRLAAAQRDLQAYTEGLSFLEGLPVGAKVLEERMTREEADAIAFEARLVLSGRVDDAEGLIADETAQRIAADSVEQSARLVLSGRVDDAEGLIADETAQRIAADSVEQSARLVLSGRVDDNYSDFLQEVTTRTTNDSAFTQLFQLLGAQNPGGSAFKLNVSTVEVGEDGPLATVLSGLYVADANSASEIVTLQSASSDQASQITSLSVTTGDNTNSITSLFSATADLELRAALSLNANGVNTGYEIDGITRSIYWVAENFALVATDAGGTAYYPFAFSDGKIAFTADVKIDGDLLVTGSVAYGPLAAGAASNSNADYTAGIATLSAGDDWTEVESADLAVIGGRPVKVSWALRVRWINLSGGDGGNVLVRIKRGATVIWDGTLVELPAQRLATVYDGGGSPTLNYVELGGRLNQIVASFIVDEAAPAGTHTYAIEVKPPAQETVTVAERALDLVERRR